MTTARSCSRLSLPSCWYIVQCWMEEWGRSCHGAASVAYHGLRGLLVFVMSQRPYISTFVYPRRSRRCNLVCPMAGSVLAPISFPSYTADLLQFVKCHDLHLHVCADNTQIYEFCCPLEADVLQHGRSLLCWWYVSVDNVCQSLVEVFRSNRKSVA